MKNILIFIFALTLSSMPASAALLNMNFNGSGFSGEAVIGEAGDYWNSADRGSGTVILRDADNAFTSYTVSIGGGDGNWNLSGGSGFSGTPLYELMNNFIYTGGSPITLLFQGLSAGTHYNLYLYGQSDWNSHLFGTKTTVGTEVKTSNYDNINSLVEGTNYLNFRGAVAANGELLVVINVAPGKVQAMTNGFQLELNNATPVSVPGLFGILGAGLLGFSLKSRRIQTKSAT